MKKRRNESVTPYIPYGPAPGVPTPEPKMRCWAVTGMTVTAPRAPQTTQSPGTCRVAPGMEAAATDKGKEAGCRITGTML